MGMNITHGRIGRISIRILLRRIGKRADGLEKYRLGVLGVGTAPVYEFLYLDLGFRNWFGVCVGILGFPQFFVWVGTQVFLIFGDESCASVHVL